MTRRSGSAPDVGGPTAPADARAPDGGAADPDLQHAPGCPSERVETYDVEHLQVIPAPGEWGLRQHRSVYRVTRCVDCGAQTGEWLVRAPRIEPGTSGWNWAREYAPSLLIEQGDPLGEKTWSPVTDRDLMWAEARQRRA